MKILAHRGNLNGPSLRDNHPEYLETAMLLGFDCEVDVWYDYKNWWLGHDKPTYKVTRKWLRKNSEQCWYHAKNIAAFEQLVSDDHIKETFWHERDKFTLTKGGYIWTFPGNQPTKKSIIMLDQFDKIPLRCYAICSDYLSKFRIYD